MHRTLRLVVVFCAIASALALAPVTAQERGGDPFTGELRGDGLTLVLTIDTANERYAGTLTFGGKRYPAHAVPRGGGLDGAFRVGDDEHPFTLRRDGDAFVLTSDGRRYALRPAAAAAANDDAVPDTGFPAWLRAGTRITYWGGSRSMPGDPQNYVPDPNGNVSIGGKPHRLEDAPGAAGSGYSHFDVVGVADGVVGILQSNYVPVDAQLANYTRTNSIGLRGDARQISDVWIHPAQLAAMPETTEGKSFTRRVRYPLDGKTYDAVTTQIASATGFLRSTYDLATGLLLVHTSSTTGASTGLAPAGTNYAKPAAGVTTIVSSRFVSVREMDLPWRRQPMPAFLTAGRTLDYTGTCTNSLGQGIVAPWRYDVRIAVAQIEGGHARAQVSTRLDYGGAMQPQVAEWAQVYGAGSPHPLWIEPQILGRMRQGQVFDQDPVTRRRIRCVGGDERVVAIVDEGPLDSLQTAYDRRTGVAVGIDLRLQQGPATMIYRVHLVERR